MKKRIIALLLSIAMLFMLASCAELIPGPGEDPDNENPTDPEIPDEDPGTETDLFEVTVMLDGKPYEPENTEASDKALKVRWTGTNQSYTANVDKSGKAYAEGLDGDFAVTLLNVPDGYTYNPNIYKATNFNKELQINLIKITKTTAGDGSSGSRYKIPRTGSYRAVIKTEGQVVYYQYEPTKPGIYYVEAMMDITSNMYNPILKVYQGNAAAGYWNEIAETDGGGAENTYTKNFLHKIVHEAGTGGGYSFAIRVEGKDAVYPVNVDFTVTYAGTVEDNMDTDAELMIPEYIPSSLNYFDMLMYDTLDISHLSAEDLNNPTYMWLKDYRAYLSENLDKFGSNTWVDAAERVDGKLVFNEDDFKLCPTDGYYHLYDAVKYAETDGFGPILYADVAKGHLFSLDPNVGLNKIEYAGSKALTIEEGAENYKLFIEGYYELTLRHGDSSGPYFCNDDYKTNKALGLDYCECYETYDIARLAFLDAIEDYKTALKTSDPDIASYVNAIKVARNNLSFTNGGSCDGTCDDCNATCRRLPLEYKLHMGYANIAIDGRVPVTAELKDFLQKFSESQRYFSDGNGWVETFGYTAFEDSQWLFPCGYFKEN